MDGSSHHTRSTRPSRQQYQLHGRGIYRTCGARMCYQLSALRASHSYECTVLQHNGMTGRDTCALTVVDYLMSFQRERCQYQPPETNIDSSYIIPRHTKIQPQTVVAITWINAVHADISEEAVIMRVFRQQLQHVTLPRHLTITVVDCLTNFWFCLKVGFHYPSSRAELTARELGCIFWHPSTRPVNSGSGNRPLLSV